MQAAATLIFALQAPTSRRGQPPCWCSHSSPSLKKTVSVMDWTSQILRTCVIILTFRSMSPHSDSALCVTHITLCCCQDCLAELLKTWLEQSVYIIINHKYFVMRCFPWIGRFLPLSWLKPSFLRLMKIYWDFEMRITVWSFLSYMSILMSWQKFW